MISLMGLKRSCALDEERLYASSILHLTDRVISAALSTRLAIGPEEKILLLID